MCVYIYICIYVCIIHICIYIYIYIHVDPPLGDGELRSRKDSRGMLPPTSTLRKASLNGLVTFSCKTPRTCTNTPLLDRNSVQVSTKTYALRSVSVPGSFVIRPRL